MAGDPEPQRMYPGPGLWEGCFGVLPILLIVSLGSVVAVGLAAGLAGLVVGVVAWIVIWEMLSRLYPRLSGGKGPFVKNAIYFFGPVIACVAVVAIVSLSA
jgi:hypothetical protein